MYILRGAKLSGEQIVLGRNKLDRLMQSFNDRWKSGQYIWLELKWSPTWTLDSHWPHGPFVIRYFSIEQRHREIPKVTTWIEEEMKKGSFPQVAVTFGPAPTSGPDIVLPLEYPLLVKERRSRNGSR